jgi:hypothetical protein
MDQLTSNIDQLKDSGSADVKLSPTTRDQYLKLINDYRSALKAESDKMVGLVSLGNPGTFGSANQTRNNLQDDVTGLGGIQRTMGKHLDYLDEFSDTVKKTADRLIANG